MSRRALLIAVLLGLAAACGGSTPPATLSHDHHDHDHHEPYAPPPLSSERGGRVFDRWSADPSATPGARGPRLKDLFGWDLRGTAGIYGPSYLAKPGTLDLDLLADPRSEDELVAWLTAGGDGVPAMGERVDADAIRSVARLVVEMRDGTLPRADWIWTLSGYTPGVYVLAAGGDAARGKALYAERCSDCHGDDGAEFLFDDGAYTLGTHARQKAYEDWFKLLSGQPGSGMGRQVTGTAREMAQQMLDLFAALCDRAAFPAGRATGSDVPDGDLRCGAYLR